MRLLLILFACVGTAAADESIAGRWEGSARIPGHELKLIVDLAQVQSGRDWAGSIILPGFGVKGAALADISIGAGSVAFALKAAPSDLPSGPAKLAGRISADGKMEGDFVLGGNTAPFTLSKIGPAQVEVAPRSTSIAKELEGEWKGGYVLFGYPRKVTIKLANQPNSGATADFVIVGKKENILPVDLVTQEGDFVTIDSHETGLSFEGRARKGEIKGTILQGPLTIPIDLHREK